MSKASPEGRKSKKTSDQTDETSAVSKEDSLKTLVWGFFASLLLTILPVGSIVRGIVNLLLIFVKPLLLLLGALKIWEEVERRRKP